MSQTNEQPERQSTDKFPCPACGGNMTFNPESQLLQCQYCDNQIAMDSVESEILEKDFNDAINEEPNEDWGGQTKVIQCENCGGETVLEGEDTSKFCAFCGSPHVVSQDEFTGIKPESVVPFKIDSKGASNLFGKWIKKRFFAPNTLKEEYRSQKMKGVYIPFWTYDSDTYSSYMAEAGTYYYETVTRTVVENGETKTRKEQVRKTRWRWVSGTYSKFFDDVLINASKHVSEPIINKLQPYHLKELVPYQSHYLSGFQAERYSKDLKQGWEEAQGSMKDDIRTAIRRQIIADTIRNLSVRTTYNKITYKHILLPVWISAYKYRSKLYQFMINGQTGEVQGKIPLSFWKIAGTIVAVGAVLTGAYFLLSALGAFG